MLFLETFDLFIFMDYIFSNVDFIKLPLFSLDDQKYKFVEVKAMDSADELGFFSTLK